MSMRMYQLWYGKQCSGFCGTGQMISRWDPDASESCPNCGRFETADHLTQCDNRIRRDLLKEGIRDLDDWMSWHCRTLTCGYGFQVHPEGRKMSQNMRIVGNTIDRIGWRHFTEGKLPNAFRDMQRQHQHLLSHHKYLTIDKSDEAPQNHGDQGPCYERIVSVIEETLLGLPFPGVRGARLSESRYQVPICYGKLAPIVLNLNQPASTGPNLIGHCPPNVRPRPPLKRRRQSNHRVVVGSNRLRLQGKVTYDDPGPSDQPITLLNRKRNDYSVALEESTLKDMTQRHARRRKKASQAQD
eukprot:scaffold5718_cov112-Skeletonema_dohrnii-CCMP3373.AAC.7